MRISSLAYNNKSTLGCDFQWTLNENYTLTLVSNEASFKFTGYPSKPILNNTEFSMVSNLAGTGVFKGIFLNQDDYTPFSTASLDSWLAGKAYKAELSRLLDLELTQSSPIVKRIVVPSTPIEKRKVLSDSEVVVIDTTIVKKKKTLYKKSDLSKEIGRKEPVRDQSKEVGKNEGVKDVDAPMTTRIFDIPFKRKKRETSMERKNQKKSIADIELERRFPQKTTDSERKKSKKVDEKDVAKENPIVSNMHSKKSAAKIEYTDPLKLNVALQAKVRDDRAILDKRTTFEKDSANAFSKSQAKQEELSSELDRIIGQKESQKNASKILISNASKIPVIKTTTNTFVEKKKEAPICLDTPVKAVPVKVPFKMTPIVFVPRVAALKEITNYSSVTSTPIKVAPLNALQKEVKALGTPHYQSTANAQRIKQGYKNLGNSCYMASILHFITTLTLPSSPHSDNAFMTLYRDLQAMKSDNDILNPELFLKGTQKLFGWGGRRQEDAHEYFMYCTTYLAEYEWKMEKTVSCLSKKCSYKNKVSEYFNDMSVDFQSSSYNAHMDINGYFAKELVDLTCDCGHGKAQIDKRIGTSPGSLVVHLKRFAGTKNLTKRLDRVKIDSELDLRKYGGSVYVLTSIVNHWGHDMDRGYYHQVSNYILGHYTCDIKSKEGWVSFDDTNRTDRTSSILESRYKSWYMLGYIRKDLANIKKGADIWLG